MTMTYYTSGKFGSGPEPEDWKDTWETSSPPGYVTIETLGIGPAPVTVLYAQADTARPGPGHLIELSDGSSTEYIGANSLRDAMDLLARWAPVATASVLSYFCEILTGDDSLTDATLARLIGRIRADDREGAFDQAEDEILAARREGRKAWMAQQASPDLAQTADGVMTAEPGVFTHFPPASGMAGKAAQENGLAG
jgi:hypothetical protein